MSFPNRAPDGWNAHIDPPRILGGVVVADTATEVPFANEMDVVRGAYRSLNQARPSQRSCGAMVLSAAISALSSPTPQLANVDGRRRAIAFGTCTGALNEVARFIHESHRVGSHLVNPGLFPFTVLNAATGLAAIEHDYRGANLTYLGGPGAVGEAVISACDMIEAGNADLVVAGGFEAIGEEVASHVPENTQIAVLAGAIMLVSPALFQTLRVGSPACITAHCRRNRSTRQRQKVTGQEQRHALSLTAATGCEAAAAIVAAVRRAEEGHKVRLEIVDEDCSAVKLLFDYAPCESMNSADD